MNAFRSIFHQKTKSVLKFLHKRVTEGDTMRSQRLEEWFLHSYVDHHHHDYFRLLHQEILKIVIIETFSGSGEKVLDLPFKFLLSNLLLHMFH